MQLDDLEDAVNAIPLLMLVAVTPPALAPAVGGVVGAQANPVAAVRAANAPVPEQAALSVDVLVALALERSPSLAAQRSKLLAAREMVAPAGALPDPMVELMLADMGFPKYTVGTDEMSMIGPEVRQGLLYPGKRESRRLAARAESGIRGAELDQVARELIRQVRTIYARLFAVDRERQSLGAASELLDLLAATAAARYGVGEAEQEAVIKAQIEVSRVAERLDDLAADRAALAAALNRLLDQPGDAPIGAVADLPLPVVPPEPWAGLALAASSEVAVRRAAVDAAARRLDVARLELKPNLSAGAALGLRGGFDPAVTLRFGVELPLWKGEKQRPLIRAAEHELDMARAELRDAEASSRAEAARLAAEWRRAERQILRYREAILPQSSAAMDAARASYLAGRGDFSTVIEDFALWLDARVELARRQADRFITWAELEALTSRQIGDEPAAAPKEDRHDTR